VSPETNFNDKEVIKKMHDFTSKTQKLKSSWYKRSLDSNNLAYTLKVPSVFTLSSDIRSFFLIQNFNSSSKSQALNKQFDFTSKTLNLDFSETLYNTFKNAQTFLFRNSILTSPKRIQNKINSTDSIHVPSVLSLPLNNISNTHNLFNLDTNAPHGNLVNTHFLKKLSEIQKVCTYYTDNNKSLISLINANFIWKSSKELSKYTFDLKPKFGFKPTKVDLNATVVANSKLITGAPIIVLSVESESEFKNLGTFFKYFLVVDQNRKTLNRSNKLTKIDVSSRLNKLDVYINGGTLEAFITPKFFKTLDSFNPLPTYKENGNRVQLTGVNPVYKFDTVKSIPTFINVRTPQLIENKTWDFDFFSPCKYNVSSDLSSTQSNIRSQKKLLFNQRLLHTTSVLVLPTKLNITVITNSYDVIHS